VDWPGAAVLTLTELAGTPALASADPVRWLTAAAERLARGLNT
jgi:hypothetical protein